MDAKNLRAEAMRLPAEERRALGQELLESVFGEEHLDEANWKCFVNATWDAATDEWKMEKKPVINL